MSQQQKELQGSTSSALSKEEIEDFREAGIKLVKYLIEHYYSEEAKPIVKQEAKIEFTSPPSKGKKLEDIFEEYKAQYANLCSNTQSVYNLKPYQTYATISSAIGDMMGLGVGTPMFTWVATPLSTELEIMVTNELAKKIKLPEKFYFENNGLGIINFCLADGMVAPVFAAKHQYLAKNQVTQAPPPFVVYLSNSPDFAFVRRNLELADFIVKRIEKPDMIISDLKADTEAGLQPLFISLNYPVMKISAQTSEFCSSHNIWLHCDTQDMGLLSLLEEYEGQVKDYQQFSSISIEGGYWLGTGMETSLLWVVNREKIKEALEFPFLMKKNVYLKTENQKVGYDINYKDYQVHLGRRMRSLKMWAVFNVYGAEGLRLIFRQRIEMMKTLESKLKSKPDRISNLNLAKPHELRFKLNSLSVEDFVKKCEEKGIQIGTEGEQVVVWVNPFKMDQMMLSKIADLLLDLAE